MTKTYFFCREVALIITPFRIGEKLSEVDNDVGTLGTYITKS